MGLWACATRLLGRAEVCAQGHGLAEAHVRRSVAPALRPHETHEPAEGLGGLRRAPRLAGVLTDLLQLVVRHGDRDDREVVDAPFAVRVDEVDEQPEPRRAELAGARARALDEPLQRLARGDEAGEPVAQRDAIDRIVAAAADEDHVRATPQRTERPERHVDAAEDCERRQAVIVKAHGEGAAVEVGLVASQHDGGGSRQQLADGGDLRRVVVDRRVSRAEQRATGTHEPAVDEIAVTGSQFLKVTEGAGLDLGRVASALPREVGERTMQCSRVRRVLGVHVPSRPPDSSVRVSASTLRAPSFSR